MSHCRRNVGVVDVDRAACGDAIASIVPNQALEYNSAVGCHFNAVASVVPKERVLHGQFGVASIKFKGIASIVFHTALVDIALDVPTSQTHRATNY